MKFDLLPNEILFECFKYLNIVHIFHSFDGLKYRFNELIRNIPLHLNFRNIHTSICEEFCKKIFSDQKIKERIYSLYLTNGVDTYYPMQLFLSKFSLSEFAHLQSLTLTYVSRDNFTKFKQILPFMTELISFRIDDSGSDFEAMLDALPIGQLRTLTVPELPIRVIRTREFSSLENLTVSTCDRYTLRHILNNVHKLTYFKAEFFYRSLKHTGIGNRGSLKDHVSDLKKLIITDFSGELSDLVMIFKQIPNLRSLTICTGRRLTIFIDNNKEIVDAGQWQDLISSSLPHLNIFKFQFLLKNENGNFEEKFNKFRSDFWIEQHHWSTNYSISKSLASIYTIPYPLDTYEVTPLINPYFSEQKSKFKKAFEYVTDLSILSDAITETCYYYFSNVTSLTLGDTLVDDRKHTSEDDRRYVLKIEQIKHLKRIVKLSNIKYLIIHACKLETPSVLTEILKEAQQLSSLKIHWNDLKTLFVDKELCKYLKMIKQLDIYLGKIEVNRSKKLDQFCETFSDIERVSLEGDETNYLLSLFLLEKLPKLLCIYIWMTKSIAFHDLAWLEDEAKKLKKNAITAFRGDGCGYLRIWTNIDKY